MSVVYGTKRKASLSLGEHGFRSSTGEAEVPTACRDLLVTPIVVTAMGVAVNGHARLAAARDLGIDEVRAVVIHHPDLRAGFREEC